MSKILVIVESPAKCKKIEQFLGSSYKVVASFGHLRNISGLQSIDVNNNFLTTYSVIEEDIKLKQIAKLRNEIDKSLEVIIATDDDREGEAIGWHICQLFNLPVEHTKRIVFHEITETAIRNAIMNPKRINMNLVNSQQARQIMDLLVGYTISPILWNKVSNTNLSAGRCQTPALRLIYDNYLEIINNNKNIIDNVVYNVIGYFTNLNLPFELNKQFNQINDFLEQCKTWDFIYTISAPKKSIRKSPEPLTTSLLQQLSSNELRLSPKDTMKYAQQLYEHGYITYMRTDSKKYSMEFIDSVKIYVLNEYGEKYISQSIDNLVVSSNNNKNANVNEESNSTNQLIQEAHEAIRPVNINNNYKTLVDDNLHPKAVKLYEIIWKRSIESCMASAQYTTLNALIKAPLNTQFVFKTEQVVFLGWQIIDQHTNKGDETDTSHYQYIQTLKQNVSLSPKKINAKFVVKELKSHYSEARLVQLLEEKGIGRPSTFASLIDKIQERKYVLKQDITGTTIEGIDYSLDNNEIIETVSKKLFGNEKSKLVIQPLGIIVIEYLLEKFESFFNYDFTREMEDELDQVANGGKVWYQLCEKCYSQLTELTNKVKEEKKFSINIDENHQLIIGKYGPIIKCTTDENKVSFIPVKKELDIDAIKNSDTVLLEDLIDDNLTKKQNEPIGKYKGHDLYINKGKYGLYAKWGNDTKSLKNEFEHVSIDDIKYMDVIKYLEEDVLDSKKPVGLIRELNEHLSIRTGKYGDYIFYKKPRAKKPQFLKLNGFKQDYKKCDKTTIFNWIKEQYKVE